MSNEINKGIMDIGVTRVNLNELGWIKENPDKPQFEEPSNGAMLKLTADRPLNQQLVRLPEGYISAALFFSHFPEDVFRDGPSHPNWYATFATVSMELAAFGSMPPIEGLPD